LRDAIDSALAQTYADVEVVVVDDGSADDSLRIIGGYGQRLTVGTRPNLGACAARNEGVRLSRGEFIQFLDADDVLVPEAIERRLSAFSDEVGLVFGDRIHIDGHGDQLTEYTSSHSRRDWDSVGMAQYIVIANIHTMEPLHRRRWVCRVGGFDEALPQGQEPDFHLRLHLAGCSFVYCPGVVGGFRQHASEQRISSSAWWKSDPERYIRFADHYMALMSERSESGLTPEFRRAMAGMLCYHSVRLAARGDPTLARRYHDELLRMCPGFRPHGIAGAAARLLGLWPTIRIGALWQRFDTSRKY
jgi:glycosyltransferase involved in cell wall biosynthesis